MEGWPRTHGEKEEETPESFPLSSTCMHACMLKYVCVHTHTQSLFDFWLEFSLLLPVLINIACQPNRIYNHHWGELWTWSAGITYIRLVLVGMTLTVRVACSMGWGTQRTWLSQKQNDVWTVMLGPTRKSKPVWTVECWLPQHPMVVSHTFDLSQQDPFFFKLLFSAILFQQIDN